MKGYRWQIDGKGHRALVGIREMLITLMMPIEHLVVVDLGEFIHDYPINIVVALRVSKGGVFE